MNPYAVLILEALLFALAFGALTWLRGEGLPSRFAWEAIGFTAGTLLLSWAAGITIPPVVFLVLLYLFTMRARLLVDLGNVLVARRSYERALAVLRAAAHLDANPYAQALVQINVGVVRVRQGRLDEGLTELTRALAILPIGHSGPKLEAACRYNLGLAHQRLGQESQARQQFQQVLELLPNSIYARGAAAALRKQQRG